MFHKHDPNYITMVIIQFLRERNPSFIFSKGGSGRHDHQLRTQYTPVDRKINFLSLNTTASILQKVKDAERTGG